MSFMLWGSAENKYNLINETNAQWVVRMSALNFIRFTAQTIHTNDDLVFGLLFDKSIDTSTQQKHI